MKPKKSEGIPEKTLCWVLVEKGKIFKNMGMYFVYEKYSEPYEGRESKPFYLVPAEHVSPEYLPATASVVKGAK